MTLLMDTKLRVSADVLYLLQQSQNFLHWNWNTLFLFSFFKKGCKLFLLLTVMLTAQNPFIVGKN